MVDHVTQTMHRTDQNLHADVSDELLYTPSIDTNLVVTIDNGVVTLAGVVSSVPERLAAIHAAEQVWGVKAVVDEMRVQSGGATGATDTDIAVAARQILAWTIDVPVDAIQLEIRDHMITLSGTVTWEFQRRAAARAVTYIRGISGVSNNISLTEHKSVSVVKAAVEAALRRNAPLDAQAITVEVNGHELTLNGHVRSSAERHQAEHVAWAAAGVAHVKNNLSITS
jgi:osmotically-inducible protein OsmY